LKNESNDVIGAETLNRSPSARLCHRLLGLGKRTKLDWLEVHWPQPGGKTERFTELPIDRYITIVEGEGRWQ